MTKSKFELSDEHLGKLLEEVPALHKDAESAHLLDDDYINYALELMGDGKRQRIATHLASCAECASEMDAYIRETEAWRGEEGERNLNAFRQRLISESAKASTRQSQKSITLFGQLSRLVEKLTIPNPFANMSPQPQFRTLMPVLPYETEDGMLGVSFTEEKNGDLSIHIESSALELEGRRIIFKADTIEREAFLRRIDVDQIGAKVVLNRDERQSLKNCSNFFLSLAETKHS